MWTPEQDPLRQSQPHQNCSWRKNPFSVSTYWSKILGWKSISSSWHSILVGIHAILLTELKSIFHHMDYQEKPRFLSLPCSLPACLAFMGHAFKEMQATQASQ